MANNQATGVRNVSAVMQRYGNCVELISMDSHFHNISVGLYLKGEIFTVWTYSDKEGVLERISQIRDQLVVLGGMLPIDRFTNQVRFTCGQLHVRPVKFLFGQAVNPRQNHPTTNTSLSIKDSKSPLTLAVASEDRGGTTIYRVEATGDYDKKDTRLRLVVAGFVRYGEMDKVGDLEIAFPCGRRHDELVRLILPYSRNVSAVENLIETEALRGQMTTNTLGFTPL